MYIAQSYWFKCHKQWDFVFLTQKTWFQCKANTSSLPVQLQIETRDWQRDSLASSALTLTRGWPHLICCSVTWKCLADAKYQRWDLCISYPLIKKTTHTTPAGEDSLCYTILYLSPFSNPFERSSQEGFLEYVWWATFLLSLIFVSGKWMNIKMTAVGSVAEKSALWRTLHATCSMHLYQAGALHLLLWSWCPVGSCQLALNSSSLRGADFLKKWEGSSFFFFFF